MNAARKAHAEAREHLEKLEKTIADEEAELEHRHDIASRYQQILSEERARIARRRAEPEARRRRAGAHPGRDRAP